MRLPPPLLGRYLSYRTGGASPFDAVILVTMDEDPASGLPFVLLQVALAQLLVGAP